MDSGSPRNGLFKQAGIIAGSTGNNYYALTIAWHENRGHVARNDGGVISCSLSNFSEIYSRLSDDDGAIPSVSISSGAFKPVVTFTY